MRKLWLILLLVSVRQLIPMEQKTNHTNHSIVKQSQEKIGFPTEIKRRDVSGDEAWWKHWLVYYYTLLTSYLYKNKR